MRTLLTRILNNLSIISILAHSSKKVPSNKGIQKFLKLKNRELNNPLGPRSSRFRAPSTTPSARPSHMSTGFSKAKMSLI
jgi:hypothetical protein